MSSGAVSAGVDTVTYVTEVVGCYLRFVIIDVVVRFEVGEAG